MQDFVARPERAAHIAEPANFRKGRHRAGGDDRRVECVTPALALDFVHPGEARVRPDDLEGVARELADFFLAIDAKRFHFGIFPGHDLRQEFVRLFRLHAIPAVSFRVMRHVDRLEDRLRRHAAGVDAERGVIRVIAHEEKDVGSLFAGDARGGETGGAAAEDGDCFTFVLKVSQSVQMSSSAQHLAQRLGDFAAFNIELLHQGQGNAASQNVRVRARREVAFRAEVVQDHTCAF